MKARTFGVILSAGVLISLSCASLFAAPITLTFSGTATGSLGSIAFTDVPYTVVSEADTSATVLSFSAQPCMPSNPSLCPIYSLAADISQITIEGFPVATFLDPTSWVDPNFSGGIVFADSGTAILGITQLFQGLETYNLQSSLGPISSSIDFPSTFFHTFQNIPTSQGALSLVAMDETFTAVVVPEPGTFAEGITCLLFLAHRAF